MSWSVLLLAAGAAAVLLVLVVKLRGGRRDDLMGPPKRKPRHLPREELDRMTEMVGRGEEAEVLRQLKGAGYDERQSKRLVWLMSKLTED
jgi:hypothetical protein